MKNKFIFYVLLTLAFTLASCNLAYAQTVTGSVPVKWVSALPTTCVTTDKARVLVFRYIAPTGLYYCSASNTWTIVGVASSFNGTLANGTAAAPSLSFSSDVDTGLFRSAADTLGFATNGAVKLTLNTAGTLTGTQATITTSNPFLTHTATWNNAAVTFVNNFSNVTDTASGAASLLTDLQVGGVSRFRVDKAGLVTAVGFATAAVSATEFGFIDGVTSAIQTQIDSKVGNASPTLITPTLGVATATSINKVAITAPATSSTLTVADGKTLTASNTLTLAGTDATTMTFPSTSATIARTDAANTFTGVQTMTSPVLTTPTIGVATATSINKVAITAPTTSATLTIADGKTLTASNTLTLAGTDATTMTFPSTSATIARTDAANTFTGVQTMSSPVLNGTVTIATPFTLGAVSVSSTGTELNFVAGVTSAIQTQLAARAPLASPTFTGVVTVGTGATVAVDRTITAGGTTGAQTINKLAGTVNFASGATAIVVTNSTAATTSLIFPVIRTADATCTFVRSVVPAAGSFTITLNAACTAETSVGFLVTN